ncbi:ATP-binding protein [Fervidicoccus fontis]|uniref:ATP-binding protein n=1 Tax=Fervidicoccus fontis TaxID=683846 RepID=UPI0011E58772|nr:ATP-binding protein [Fervidicoccus fontis]
MEGSVLVLDEAKELRRSNYRFDSLLAYIYDDLNIKVIVSGSMVELLYRFLRVEDPEAPLYGRAYSEVRLKPLPREKAIVAIAHFFMGKHLYNSFKRRELLSFALKYLLAYLKKFGSY